MEQRVIKPPSQQRQKGPLKQCLPLKPRPSLRDGFRRTAEAAARGAAAGPTLTVEAMQERTRGVTFCWAAAGKTGPSPLWPLVLPTRPPHSSPHRALLVTLVRGAGLGAGTGCSNPTGGSPKMKCILSFLPESLFRLLLYWFFFLQKIIGISVCFGCPKRVWQIYLFQLCSMLFVVAIVSTFVLCSRVTVHS